MRSNERLPGRSARHSGPTGELRLLRRAALALLLVAMAAAWLSIRQQRAAPARLDSAIGATFVSDPVARRADMLVTSLRAGGAAERAGLRVGDRLGTIDGRPARSLAQAEQVMASGQPVTLRVRRGVDAVLLTILVTGGRTARGEQDPAGRGRYHHG